MRGSFEVVRTFPNEKMLSREEIDALIANIYEIWAFLGGFPKRGTVILDGQRKGEDVEYIVWLNMKGGVYYVKTADVGSRKTSDTVALDSIVAASAWPEKWVHGYEVQAQARNFGEMATGIYQRDENYALVLNTTLGRFIMSSRLAQEVGDGEIVELHGCDTLMMKGVAIVLAKMRPKDVVLQRSVESLLKDASEVELSLKKEIEHRFELCRGAELAAWKEWYDIMATKGGLGLYFE